MCFTMSNCIKERMRMIISVVTILRCISNNRASAWFVFCYLVLSAWFLKNDPRSPPVSPELRACAFIFPALLSRAEVRDDTRSTFWVRQSGQSPRNIHLCDIIIMFNISIAQISIWIWSNALYNSRGNKINIAQITILQLLFTNQIKSNIGFWWAVPR